MMNGSALTLTLPAAPPDLPPGLSLQTNADEVIYTSPWLKVAFSSRTPVMTFLSVDGPGTGRHQGLGHGYKAVTIGISLDHGYHLRGLVG